MLALLIAASTGQHDTAPPGPGSSLPIIIGVLAAVFLVGLALWFLIVRPRMRPPGRRLEPAARTEERFQRGEAAATDAAERVTGDRLETRT
jgi:peptidoglycan/LPS O-acetylase OafA/YrhL